jgi:hypothetical protein
VGDRGRLTAAGPAWARIRETWTLAVLGVMNSAWPICRLVLPAATSARTSASRRVSPSEAATKGAPRLGHRLSGLLEPHPAALGEQLQFAPTRSRR